LAAPPEAASRSLFRLFHVLRERLRIWRDKSSLAQRRALRRRKRPWDHSVGLTLNRLIHRDETKASGTVEVLSLAELRAAIGDLWADYAERILLIAESTIARMIGRGHTFIPRSEDTWLLLFPDLTVAEAEERAEQIAARIGEKLVGERFTPHELPLPTTATLDLTGVVASDGTIDETALAAAVARARAGLKTVDEPDPEPAMRANGGGAYTMRLRSAWNASTQVVDAFFIRPLVRGQDLVLDPNVAFPATISQALCATCEGLLQEMHAHALRAKLVLPVPYALAAGPAGVEFAERVAAMPRNLRLLHLRIEIARLPHNASLEAMARVRELFRPLVRDVAFLGDGFALPSELFNLDHITVGIDLAFARGWSEAELEGLLVDVRRRAGARPVYALGLRNRAHVRIALAVWIDEIDGPFLPPLETRLPERLSVIAPEQIMTA
jgi:hypothetical protein